MGSSTGFSAFQITSFAPAVNLPEPYTKNTTFPLALAPSNPGIPLSDLISEIAHLSQSGQIRCLLNTHGAIYFKDLHLRSASDFSQFAHAFGYAPHEDIGNPVRRTALAPNVATANEGPKTQPIHPHNEFGLSPHHPAYVFFYCAAAPISGGETPLNSSVALLHHLQRKHPAFIAETERRGVAYTLFYPNAPRDRTASPGTSVLQAWGAHVLDSDDAETARRKVEAEVRRLPTATWAWENRSADNALGDLRAWQRLPAVRTHPSTGERAFFNNAVSRFLNAVAAGTLEAPHINAEGAYQPPAFYGDGEIIPSEYFDAAVEFIRETRALVPWREGGVVLLDNYAVQHGREPWTGERKLLASLWDGP
ncbi:hypothetical protein MPH_12417 [Macrophomina phaseolina MS6]|uniref:TauD/TfdA-like domain-containing protein n=1 Tax=Macrophomina phaseolina (strain MS6) TaxID=1126212 RepID=K2RKD3_MACPH|nr:hypothetical protein MPH_12417 [Macrophomina phaseolina MS6]